MADISSLDYTVPPAAGRIRQITFDPIYGMMVVPFCPHDNCGWSMPELWCPVHGNYDMTFLSVTSGSRLVHVKAVVGLPRYPLPEKPL